MSYKDPKILQNNPMSASMARTVKERDAARAASASDNAVSANLSSLVQGGVNLITQKKKDLNKLNKAVLREDQRIYDKVGSFVTEYEGFNGKSEEFFGNLIEKYNTIKTHLNNGTLKDITLGQKDLADIKNIVDQYGTAIPKVLAMASEIDQAAKIAGEQGLGAAGTLSVIGAPAEQLAIIKKISSGGPAGEQVDIRYEGGTIILADTSTGAELNIREFNRAMNSKENPYLKLVPDLSKGMTVAYDAFNKDNKGAMQNTFTKPAPGQDPNSPEATRIMSSDQEIKLKESMMGAFQTDFTKGGGVPTTFRDGGVFKEMYKQHAESIWEDMMPDGLTKKSQWPEEVPVFGDPGFDAFYKTYKEPLLDYLATVTIQNNATDVQRETQNKDKYNEIYGTGKSKGGSKEYEAKLNEFFNKADMSKQDQEKIQNASPGDAVSVTIYGKQQTFIKDA